MWGGVERGLASIKLSGSIKLKGCINENNINTIIIIIIPIKSLIVKRGWNGILSKFLLIIKGLLEPVWCRNRIWIITKTAIIIGKIKCNEKNRFRVTLLIVNPPQIHWTKSFPI